MEFDQFYQELFQERWPGLRQSLFTQHKVARRNAFSSGAIEYKSENEIPRGAEGLLHFYPMDQASIFAAVALGVQSDDKVLDMCAAPGGKTLILAEALGATGELIANELSQARRERLTKVIQQYVPREVRDHIWVTGRDGGKFSLTHREYFNKILLDAPCSAEGHLRQSEVEQWTESKSKGLAKRQYALLMSAWMALAPGGRIVYSTCSLSPYENDGVIRELTKKLTKRKQPFKLVLDYPLSEGAEPTEFGYQFLPDRSGSGPIYFSILEK